MLFTNETKLMICLAIGHKQKKNSRNYWQENRSLLNWLQNAMFNKNYIRFV